MAAYDVSEYFWRDEVILDYANRVELHEHAWWKANQSAIIDALHYQFVYLC